MGTELTGATLTVTITETLAIVHDTVADNLDFAQTCTHTFASIANVDKRIFKLPNSNLNKLEQMHQVQLHLQLIQHLEII
jgi:hypothetical protein